MGLWEGEDHFLQIDSHHRFVRHWDAKLISWAEGTGSPKPIVTTYCPSYSPAGETIRSYEPTQINFDYFTVDGIPLFKAGVIAAWHTLRRPVRARFVSGHFLFAPGSFVEEVPYNPDIYFHGEEATLGVRAFTWGYDFFHPPEVILWHEYSRRHRRKHWDDHVSAQVEMAWHDRDKLSKEQARRLLTAPFVGRYGCGAVRTPTEYEAYAGISMSHRKVQDYTLRGGEPPNPLSSAGWEEHVHSWSVTIELECNRLPRAALYDTRFWYVGFHDSTGAEIHRDDLSGAALESLVASCTGHILIRREFNSSSPPDTWTVWPMSHSHGWLEKITGKVSSLMCDQTPVAR